MGKAQSKSVRPGASGKNAVGGIPTDSPLGQLLQQWETPWLCPFTRGLEKPTMITLCTKEWPKYPLVDPEFPYHWDTLGIPSNYWVTQLKNYIVEHKMLTQEPYVEVWFHVHWEGPRPKLAKIFVQKEQEDEEDLWLTGPQWGPPPPPPPPLPTAPPPAPPPYPGLRKELDQLNQDIQNLPFILRSASAFPVREVPNGTNAQGVTVTSYVTVPIKPSELRELKKTLPRMQENAHTAAEQLELFLGPVEYSWGN